MSKFTIFRLFRSAFMIPVNQRSKCFKFDGAYLEIPRWKEYDWKKFLLKSYEIWDLYFLKNYFDLIQCR